MDQLREARRRYRRHAFAYIAKLAVWFFTVPVYIGLPALIVWVILKNYVQTNEDWILAGILVFAFLDILGLAVIAMICPDLLRATDLIEARKAYRAMLPKKERNKEKIGKIVKTVAAVSILAAVGYVVSLPIQAHFREVNRKETAYQNAVAMIREGRYTEGLSFLRKIGEYDYKEKQILIDIGMAGNFRNEGNPAAAHLILRSILTYRNPQEHLDLINEMLVELEPDYEQFLKEEKTRNAEKEKEARIALEKRISQGVPFVGMPEDRIGSTILGYPSKDVTHYNVINKDGNLTTSNRYSFYGEDGEVIFVAVCTDGEVELVLDYRKKPKKSSGKKSLEQIIPEGPSVDGFVHPDDFYDWYYDDFYTFEEAEEYYYSHGGK